MPYADLKNDFVFRRVFGHHPDVLCGLLNDFLGRSAERAIVSLEYLPPDQVPDLPGVKLSIVDVKCRDAGGATFVVEMQVLPITGFLNRVVFNACKAYVGTLKRGEGYEKLTPVIAVTVCDFELWPDGERDAQSLPRVPLVSHWGMAERSTGAPGIPQVEYVFCELPKLRDRKPADALERWVGLFVAAPMLDAATVASEPFTAAQRMALELANEASFTDAELDAYRKARDEVQQMIQYGKDGEARGEARGRVEQARASLLRVLMRRGLEATSEERARVEACTDAATLERWLDRAIDAASVAEALS